MFVAISANQSVAMPTTFDLKSQLKSNQKKSKPESEQNITITEHRWLNLT
jgi:hypothetical protein